MGISIKREETERLARQLAEATGESLTEAIHRALAAEIERRSAANTNPPGMKEDPARFFAWLDAYRGPDTGKSLAEIEEEMYGEFGEPI